MKKRTISRSAAVLLTATMLTGCEIGNTEITFDIKHTNKHVAFAVNDTKCSIKEAKLYLCNYKNLYGNEYGVNLWNYDFGDESLDDYVKDVTIDELTRITCMSLLATEQGIELTEEEKALAEEASKEYYQSLTEEEKRFTGISQIELKQVYEKYALANKLYNSLTIGVDEEVSDDEARVMKIQQIIVSEESIAVEVEAALNAGNDFASLAGTYNEASALETHIARDTYPEEVEKVAFNLENDEISGKIQASDGNYYFIKCIDKFEEELTEENKVTILEKREKEKFFDVYDSFVESASFELNKDLWESVTLVGEEGLETDSFFKVYDNFFVEEN